MSALGNRIISVSGIDGSGKTTIIEQIVTDLRAENIDAKYVWLRYNHYLTKLLLGLCRLMKLTVYENHNGVRVGYHEFFKSRIVSFLFVVTTWIDTALATLVRVYIPVLAGRTVVCDRWVPDILIDLELDTRWSGRAKKIAEKWFYSLVPGAATLLVVSRGFDDVKAARDEHEYDRNFKQRFELYNLLASSGRCQLIDNTGTIENTVNQAKEVIK